MESFLFVLSKMSQNLVYDFLSSIHAMTLTVLPQLLQTSMSIFKTRLSVVDDPVKLDASSPEVSRRILVLRFWGLLSFGGPNVCFPYSVKRRAFS